MSIAIDIQTLWNSYGLIFILMFSTFLLGYILATLFEKKNSKKALAKQKKELETTEAVTPNVKDIETIFTEIKPKIIDIVKEQQQIAPPTITPAKENSVPEKAKSTYVSYHKKKAELSISLLNLGNSDMPDDLTKIEGIGPYIEERLNKIGIYNYIQISKLELNDIRTITELIDFFPGRIERDNWVSQAEYLKLYRSKL